MPANGDYDMQFSLYDAATDGVLVAGPLIFDDDPSSSGPVPVDIGLFAVELDFGDVFDGTALWIEIDVRPFGGGGYTTLSPRQPLTATPFALHALSAPGGEGFWSANGSDIHNSNAGNVGIGTPTPQANLHIDGTGSSAVGFHMQAPGDSVGEILMGSPFGHVGIAGRANNGNRRDIYFMDTGLGLFTRNSPSSPFTGNGLFIDESGNVGVGTSAPVEKLHVHGSDARMRLSMVGDSAGPELQFRNVVFTSGAYGTIEFQDGDGNVLSNIGYGKPLLASRGLTFNTSDGGFMKLADGGNVGIGTANPEQKLHLEGGTDTSPSGGGYLVLGNTGSANISIDNNEIMARNNGATSPLFLNNQGGDIVCGGSIDINYTIVTGSPDATCPAGTRVLGGGCRISGDAEIRESYPTSSTWHCEAGDVSGFIGLTAYAICANVK